MAGINSLNGEDMLTGSYGYVMHEGSYIQNIKDFEAKVEIEKGEIKVVGDKWTKYKTLGLTGSGTMTLYKIDYAFVKLISEVAKPGGKPFVTELVGQIDDPSVTGAKEKVRLKNVQFDAIPLAKYTVGEVIEEELPFTFEGFELL